MLPFKIRRQHDFDFELQYRSLLMFSSYSLLKVPSDGPKIISFDEVDKLTYNITWAPLVREKRNGIIIGYRIQREQSSTGARSKQSLTDFTYSNSANTFALVTGFQLGCEYKISVRGFTAVGGGPFGEELTLETPSKLLTPVI